MSDGFGMNANYERGLGKTKEGPCPKCDQPLEAHGGGLGQISPQGCRMVELEKRIEGKIVASPGAILAAIQETHQAAGYGHLFSYSLVRAALEKLT